LVFASGDEPSMSVVPCAPDGMSKRNGGRRDRGTGVVHDVEQVVRPPLHRRVRGRGSLAAERPGPSRPARCSSRQRLCRWPPASGEYRPGRRGKLLRLEPFAVHDGNSLHGDPAGSLSNCARPASSVLTVSTRPLPKCSCPMIRDVVRQLTADQAH
jgi:hypothetical protein